MGVPINEALQFQIAEQTVKKLTRELTELMLKINVCELYANHQLKPPGFDLGLARLHSKLETLQADLAAESMYLAHWSAALMEQDQKNEYTSTH